MLTIGTKQQNRSERARPLLFDHSAQDIEDASQWHACRDHLEQPFLTGEQCLGPFALGYVPNRANVLNARFRFTLHGMK